jgi:hypothetical protein
MEYRMDSVQEIQVKMVNDLLDIESSTTFDLDKRKMVELAYEKAYSLLMQARISDESSTTTFLDK